MTPAEQMREAAAKNLDAIAACDENDADSDFDLGRISGLREAARETHGLPLPPEPPVEAMAAALRAFVKGYEGDDDRMITAYHAAAPALAEYDAWRAGYTAKGERDDR